MELIDLALDYLQITWEDATLRRKLEAAIPRGQALINGYAGGELDYEESGEAQSLLLDYLRYVRSDATEMFEGNYRHDLMNLREHTLANQLRAEEEAEAETDAAD